jgi:hypothetical protein
MEPVMFFGQFIPAFRKPFDLLPETGAIGSAPAWTTGRQSGAVNRERRAASAEPLTQTAPQATTSRPHDASSHTHGTKEPEWQGQWRSLKYI